MKHALILALFTATAFAGDGLNEEQLKAGMAKVKDDVAACGRTYSQVKGIIKVAIEVAPSGQVSHVKLLAGDHPLGACIVNAIKSKATFAASQAGASFHYPYAF